MKSAFVLSVVASSLITMLPLGALAIDDVISARQKDMKEIAASAKAIAEMFKSPETYSATRFKTAAIEISSRAGDTLTDHFSKLAVADGSKATQSIQTDHDRFSALARDLKTYADVLAKAADINPGEMTDRMRMKPGEPMGGGPLGTRAKNEDALSEMAAEHAFHLMLQTCTACHSRFRAKE